MTRKSQPIETGDGPGKIKSKYQKGTRFEHKVRDDLESRGYMVVRAAGSKGATKIDLIAFKIGVPMMLIQAKTGTAQITKIEWDMIFSISEWYRGVSVPVVAENGPKGRGVTYSRITGKRVKFARVQPCQPYDPGPVLPIRQVDFIDNVSIVIHDPDSEPWNDGIPKGPLVVS